MKVSSYCLGKIYCKVTQKWNSQTFLPLDPFALKRNVARSLNSQMVFEYIQERFRTAYKYFACPQKRGTEGRQRGRKASKQSAKIEETMRKEAVSVNNEEDNGKDEKSGSLKEEESDSEEEDDSSDPSTKNDDKTLDACLMDMALCERSKTLHSPNDLLDSDKNGEEKEFEEDKVSNKDVTSEDLHYVFDKMIFTGGKVIMIDCTKLFSS